MKKLTFAALALASSAASAVPVSYGSSAAFTGLSYRLIDLDPLDGIAASVQFKSGAMLAEAHLHNIKDSLHSSSVQYAWAPGTASAARGSASAYITGGTSFSGVVSGSAFNGALFDAYESRVQGALNMVLGAKTAIEWVASYAVTAWATPQYGASGFDFASAAVRLGDTFAAVGAYANPLQGVSALAQSGLLSYRISNDSSRASNEHAYFFASALGGQVAPIPEPSSWLMGLAGLGVLGVVVSRRSPGRRPEPGQPS